MQDPRSIKPASLFLEEILKIKKLKSMIRLHIYLRGSLVCFFSKIRVLGYLIFQIKL